MWDLVQQMQIHDNAVAGSRTAANTNRLEDRFRAQQREMDRLALACAAVWELIRERTGLMDEDLLERMREIDLRDGKLDGKLQRERVCAQCGRRASRTRDRCMYCGASVGHDGPLPS